MSKNECESDFLSLTVKYKLGYLNHFRIWNVIRAFKRKGLPIPASLYKARRRLVPYTPKLEDKALDQALTLFGQALARVVNLNYPSKGLVDCESIPFPAKRKEANEKVSRALRQFLWPFVTVKERPKAERGHAREVVYTPLFGKILSIPALITATARQHYNYISRFIKLRNAKHYDVLPAAYTEDVKKEAPALISRVRDVIGRRTTKLIGAFTFLEKVLDEFDFKFGQIAILTLAFVKTESMDNFVSIIVPVFSPKIACDEGVCVTTEGPSTVKGHKAERLSKLPIRRDLIRRAIAKESMIELPAKSSDTISIIFFIMAVRTLEPEREERVYIDPNIATKLRNKIMRRFKP